MPGKRGKGTGQNPGQVTLWREKINNRGEKFPKPEHGGLCQLGLEIAVKKGGQPRNATTRDGVHLGSNHWARDRYQFYGGAFTV